MVLAAITLTSPVAPGVLSSTQVIEVTDSAEPREQRIALSMKLVNQADGADLDPSNAGAETDVSVGGEGGGTVRIVLSVCYYCAPCGSTDT